MSVIGGWEAPRPPCKAGGSHMGGTSPRRYIVIDLLMVRHSNQYSTVARFQVVAEPALRSPS